MYLFNFKSVINKKEGNIIYVLTRDTFKFSLIEFSILFVNLFLKYCIFGLI